MIQLTSSELRTLTLDDTELSSVTQIGDGVITTGNNVVSERKKIKARFSVHSSVEPEYQLALLGSRLFASLALFLPNGQASILTQGKPVSGFSIDIPSDLSPSETPTALPMGFYCEGNAYPESSRNLNAWFYYYDTDDFAIEFEFYVRFDENGYPNATGKSSEFSFISEQWNELNNKIIDASVYSTDKDIRVMTYIENALVEGQEVPYSEKQETVLATFTTSRYDGTVQLIDSNGEFATFLNPFEDRDYTLRFTTTNETLTDFYLKLIRIQEDPAYSFIDNLDIQENLIKDSNLTSNVFKAPFDADLHTYDGSFYELTFTIDHTYLEKGSKYRLIVVGYGSGSPSQGISAQLTAIQVLPYCLANCPDEIGSPKNLNFTGSLTDLHDEYFGNSLTAAIEERLRTKLIVDYSDDRWKNNLDCRLSGQTTEIQTTNDLRKYLQGVSLEFYTNVYDATLGGTVKNVLVQEFLNKTGVNTFNSPNLNFAFDLSAETLTLYYDFRNRNEDNLPCLYSFLNGNPYLPVLGNQYWGGKQIYIRWSLVFNYYDFPSPFTDTLYFTQTLTVRDYSSDVTVQNFDKTTFCDSGNHCIEASIVFGTPSDYKLISTRQLVQGALTENEGFTPDNLGQEVDAVIVSTENDYTGGTAKFCVDGSQLMTGNSYKFSVMAKKWL